MTDRSEIRITEATIPSLAFSIAVEPRRDAVVIAPTGELDLATAGELERKLAEPIDAGVARIMIDLRGVEFLDCAGLHALLTAHAQAQRDNWELRIIPGPRAVQRIFEVTGTIDLLPFTTANGRAALPQDVE